MRNLLIYSDIVSNRALKLPITDQDRLLLTISVIKLFYIRSFVCFDDGDSHKFNAFFSYYERNDPKLHFYILVGRDIRMDTLR